jgi:hypothetical protein
MRRLVPEPYSNSRPAALIAEGHPPGDWLGGAVAAADAEHVRARVGAERWVDGRDPTQGVVDPSLSLFFAPALRVGCGRGAAVTARAGV